MCSIFIGFLIAVTFPSIPSAGGPPVDEPSFPPVATAWASGPIDAKILFRKPIDSAAAQALIGQRIELRSVNPSRDEPVSHLNIAGVERSGDGHVLSLRTDPHSAEGRYTLVVSGRTLLSYGLSGVEAQWFEGPAEPSAGPPDAKPSWRGWVPNFNPADWEASLADSFEHRQLFGLLRQPGLLTLNALVRAPEEPGARLSVQSTGPIEGELSLIPLNFEAAGSSRRAETLIETPGEPAELLLLVPTSPNTPLASVEVAIHPAEAEGSRSLSREDLLLPWVPAGALAMPPTAPPLPAVLLGGNPIRGEQLFFGDQAKCSACHKVGDRGGAVGPDLTHVASRLDPASLYREIDSPSTVIHPDYLPYTVATHDGRVVAGILRAVGADQIKVLDTAANAALLRRDEIDELRPSATSIMPVGLVGVLGESGMRDLFAYLLQLR